MITNPRLDVLRCAAQGLTSLDTARRLGNLREDTVKGHLRAWRLKLGARNTAHAVSLAHRAGLLGGPVLDALPCPRCQRAALARIHREDTP